MVRGRLSRGALPVERADGPEQVAEEAAGAPVRLGRFAPCLVESGRLVTKKPQSPPEESEQGGKGNTRGLREPGTERNVEQRRRPPAACFELRKELHHSRAALDEVSNPPRHGSDLAGHSENRFQPFPSGIEP